MKCAKLAAIAAGVAVAAAGLVMAPGSLHAGASPSPASVRLAGARSQAPARPAVVAGTKLGVWGNARQLPGTAALNKGGDAEVQAVSCGKPGTAAGNCAAAGFYTDASHRLHAFVADERSGTWGTAIEVPGSAALNKGDNGDVGDNQLLACTTAGNCAVVGGYVDAHGHDQFFVADEKNGTWGTARTLSSSMLPGPGQIDGVSSAACGSPGNCAVTGSYARADNHTEQAFVADEKNGTWAPAITLPGSDGLNIGGNASGTSVACPSTGRCAVVGTFKDASDHTHTMVADEANGTWGQAHDLPVTEAPATEAADGMVTSASSVACAAPGDCAATGDYSAGTNHLTFVADETNGQWGPGRALPGQDSLGLGGLDAFPGPVACSTAGNCGVGGEFSSPGSATAAFVANERSGGWDDVQQLFGGTTDFNAASFAGVRSLSCPADGDCTATGNYASPAGGGKVFVVSEVDGSWDNVQLIPGLAALDKAGSESVTQVSCAAPGDCAAAGSYGTGGNVTQAFVVDQSAVTTTTLALSAPSVRPGHADAEKLTAAVTARIGAPPAGLVTVAADQGTTVCVITLDAAGKGGCTVGASQFGPGTYQLTAAYGGSDTYSGSKSAAHALTVTRHGAWGSARPVPGLAGLDKGSFEGLGQAACGSAGNCAAVGDYFDAANHEHAYVINEKNGAWGTAAPAPGTAALGNTEGDLVSCASGTNCGAAGVFGSGVRPAIAFGAAASPPGAASGPGAAAPHTAVVPPSTVVPRGAATSVQVFVADAKNGTWGNAHPLPGLAALNIGNDAFPVSLSCRLANNCTLGGVYLDAQSRFQVFVADEKNGAWGRAIEVPGTAAVNKGDAFLTSAWCASPGNCAAAGTYQDAATNALQHAFVAEEVNGTWQSAREITLGPGTSDAIAEAASCPAPGACAVTGDYRDGDGRRQVFVAEEAGGTWNPAAVQAIPGVASLNAGGSAQATSIFCTSPGSCEAGGTYSYGSGTTQSYIASEHGGTWSDARQLTVTVPGHPASSDTRIGVIRCPSAGNCAAVGGYDNAQGTQTAFVVNEAAGTWGRADLVPGITGLAQGRFSAAFSLSCPSLGSCALGGNYSSAAGQRAFLADQSPVTATALALSATTIRTGHEQAEKLTITVKSRTTGTPSGTVTIRAGTIALCTVTLSAAKATCTLRASQLRPGSYQLTATYNGSDIYDRSTSAAHKLTVTK